MAIVFISPREKQKMFIFGIVGLFFIVLILIGLMVFLAKPKKATVEQFFNAPEIGINFDILDSDVIKNLELFPEIKKEFNYTARTSKKIVKSGVITASSQEEAIQSLTTLGLLDIVLEEIEGGRDNPFTPYYGVKPPI